MNQILLWIMKYKYGVLFPFAAFEGPIFAMAVGFLVHLGYLSFLPTYGILILGDVIPDTVYYYIGRWGNNARLIEKYGSKFKIISGNFPLVERLWKDHPRKTMFLSKLAYGLSTPFLISAGLVKMPFKKFISLTIPITLGQYLVFLTIGYYLGNSYELLGTYIKDAEYVVALLLLIFIGIYVYLSRYARKQLTKMDIEESKTEEK